MKRIISVWGIVLLGFSGGCQQASSVAPPASSKKLDVHVDAPGVKVDVNGRKQEP